MWQRTSFRHRFSPGFTLVELLVVISIIAILVTILLPALSAINETAQRTVCMTNLRTLSQASYSYANEYNGFLPRDYSPAGVTTKADPPSLLLPEILSPRIGGPDLVSYAEGLPDLLARPFSESSWNRDKELATIFKKIDVLQCPSFPPKKDYGAWSWPNPLTNERVTLNNQYYDYVTNAFDLGPGTSSKGLTRLGQVPRASDTILLTEAAAWLPVAFFQSHDVSSPGHLAASEGNRMMSINDRRHGGLVNMGYFDGHVSTRRVDTVGPLDFDPTDPNYRD
jgi:prepilin-type N-terminal cleavage/methylation domain-containing protein/prepilin-type processing-associated H-X9-DG protein